MGARYLECVKPLTLGLHHRLDIARSAALQGLSNWALRANTRAAARFAVSKSIAAAAVTPSALP
jgi:hypothetical protein